MKIKTEIGGSELEIPEEIIEAFKETFEELLTEEILINNGIDAIRELLSDFIPKDLDGYKNMVSKEMALFLVNMTTGFVNDTGGYPIENWHEFEIEGERFCTIAYGWTEACQEAKGSLSMITFKVEADKEKKV